VREDHALAMDVGKQKATLEVGSKGGRWRMGGKEVSRRCMVAGWNSFWWRLEAERPGSKVEWRV
jgi:hypothetical protein